MSRDRMQSADVLPSWLALSKLNIARSRWPITRECPYIFLSRPKANEYWVFCPKFKLCECVCVCVCVFIFVLFTSLILLPVDLGLVRRPVRHSPTSDNDNLGENKRTTSKASQARARLPASRRRTAQARLRSMRSRYAKLSRSNYEHSRRTLLEAYSNSVASCERSLEILLKQQQQDASVNRELILGNANFSNGHMLAAWDGQRGTLDELINVIRQQRDEAESKRRHLLQEGPNLPESWYIESSDDESMEYDSETDVSSSGSIDTESFDELLSIIKSITMDVLKSTYPHPVGGWPVLPASVDSGENSRDKGVFAGQISICLSDFFLRISVYCCCCHSCSNCCS